MRRRRILRRRMALLRWWHSRLVLSTNGGMRTRFHDTRMPLALLITNVSTSLTLRWISNIWMPIKYDASFVSVLVSNPDYGGIVCEGCFKVNSNERLCSFFNLLSWPRQLVPSKLTRRRYRMQLRDQAVIVRRDTCHGQWPVKYQKKINRLL